VYPYWLSVITAVKLSQVEPRRQLINQQNIQGVLTHIRLF
jgi:hypothetical protein